MSTTTYMMIDPTTGLMLVFFAFVFLLALLFGMYLVWPIHDERKDDY